MKNLPMLIFALIILLFSVNFSHSADYWAKTYGGHLGDYAESVQQTFDGGYIVTGYTASFFNTTNFWAVKLDENGDISWEKTYGGGDFFYPWIIQQTVDSGFIVAGHPYSFTMGDEKQNILLFKLDENGDIVWQKKYGGSDDDIVSTIQQTSDGGYIVAGCTYSFGAGSDDVWILKLDKEGDIAWQKTYGGSETECAESIQQTSDGGYIVAGGAGSFSAGAKDIKIWVLKLDENGNVSWQKAYRGSEDNEIPNTIQQTLDGGYIVAGETWPSHDPWLLKLDENGNVSWQNNYSYFSQFKATLPIQQTTDKGYIMTGTTDFFGVGSADVLLLKLDENGEIVWQKTYGGIEPDGARSIQQITEGGYIVTGWTESFVGDEWGFEKGNMFLLKTDSNGEIPDCDIIGTSNITAYSEAISVQNTNAIITSTTATITETNILPQNTSAEITVICESTPDSDDDGMPDDQDNCTVSNLEESITIDGCVAEYGCNKTVANQLLDGGCTMSDLIVECIDSSSNHGEFVNCVNHLTNDWRNNGFINEKEKEAIQSCAAESNIP